MSEDKSIQLQAASVAALNRIASALEAIALTKAPAPNFVRPIGEYAVFEFESIGAKVTARDQHGVTAVEWAGYQWTRRSPSNKFGSAIWFSRAAGKDEAGSVRYVRLITFREPTEPEPLPGKVAAQIESVHTQAGQAMTQPAAVPAPAPAPAPAPSPAPSTPSSQAKPAAGNGRSALIKTPAWTTAATALNKKLVEAGIDYYQGKDGKPNLYHMAGSAAKCGYSEITEANLLSVLRDLEQHAREQSEAVPF